MSAPETLNPRTMSEALTLLAEAPASTAILAGGTDLLVRMRDRRNWPERILHLGRIDELRGVDQGAEEISIGALTSHSDLLRLQEQSGWGALLAQAARQIGSVQIRNRGTIGGNLVNASSAGDLIPALYVLEARLVLCSSQGTRELPVAGFFTGAGKTACRADEILNQVVFSRPAQHEKGLFIKLGQRRAQAISKVMLALWYGEEQGKLVNVRIALGAVASTVVRCPRTEAHLTGRRLTSQVISQASRIVQEEVQPISDIRSTAGYRRQMCGVLLVQALEHILAAS